MYRVKGRWASRDKKTKGRKNMEGYDTEIFGGIFHALKRLASLVGEVAVLLCFALGAFLSLFL